MNSTDERSSPFSVLMMVVLFGVGAFFAYIIFKPNYLENPINVRMTKVNGELRSIATSIFDMETANRVVSTPLNFSNDFVFGSVDEVFPDLVTTIDPLEIGDLFKDEYNPSEDLYRAAKWNDTFVLISVGPDEVLNVTEGQIKEAMENQNVGKMARLEWAYSPTNGLDSSGDIFRVQQ
ncbi:MAG: hypothetical protein H6751_15585 [Candidatus Omnitrophica bacterium]|nr:hypothetical protein [Candidatus Omnitrophota bacterium]MCB9784384.1 hypothetical protein [Candidatus Omnitrophota bacterium]